MACDRMRELALLSADGELTEAERAELAAHLEGCADCRAAQAAALRVAEGVRQLAPPPVPLGFAERTLKRLDEGRARRRPRPLPWLVPFAAVAATLVAVAIFMVERHRPAPAREALVASEPRQQTAADAERARDGGDKSGYAQDAPAEKADDKAPSEAIGRLELDSEKQLAKGGKELSEEEKLKSPEGEKNGSGALLETLAQGAPADALRRIGELPRDARLGESLERALEAKLEKRRGESKDDELKDGDTAGQRHRELPPALRFLRVKGDARRIDEILTKELKDRKAPQDYFGRSVVDLDADAAKALRDRLVAAGLVCEELPAADWLRAAQRAAANEGLLARSDADKTNDEKRAKKPEAPKTEAPHKAAPEAPPETRKEEPTAGAGKLTGRASGGGGAAAPAAAAPPRIERCLFLIER